MENLRQKRGRVERIESKIGGGCRIVRPTGRKDRHSKVCTARGPRDRRVRLSASTAIQFYDVQDRLGCDRPSKAIDWLMKEAKAAIDALDELPAGNPKIQENSGFGIQDHQPILNGDEFNSDPIVGSAFSSMEFNCFPEENINLRANNEAHDLYLSFQDELFSQNQINGPVPLGFEPTPEVAQIQRMVAWDSGGGGEKGSAMEALPWPFQTVLLQQTMFSQRESLQSSNFLPSLLANSMNWVQNSPMITSSGFITDGLISEFSVSSRIQGKEEEQSLLSNQQTPSNSFPSAF